MRDIIFDELRTRGAEIQSITDEDQRKAGMISQVDTLELLMDFAERGRNKQ